MSKPTAHQPLKKPEPEKLLGLSGKHWLLLILALFLIRTYKWATAELWTDEVLSLQLFVLRPQSLLQVFRDYRIANNHFLANGIQWLWLRIVGFDSFGEYLLRLPSLLAGMGTIAIIHCCWRRWLGGTIATATALLTALSPIFTPFAYQMRGYSLAYLLATIVVTGALRLLEEKSPPAPMCQCWLFFSALLLPLTMPSAAMATCACAVATAGGMLFTQRRKIATVIPKLLPMAVGTALGVGYYLTLWQEFQKARSESGGWESAFAVAGNVLAAIAIHLGPLVVLLLWSLYQLLRRKTAANPPQSPSNGDDTTEKVVPLSNGLAYWHLFGVLLALLAVLMVPSPIHRSPYPRVFIVLLPIATLACAVIARNGWQNFLHKKPAITLLIPAAFAIVATFAFEFATPTRTTGDTPAPPQHLLMQFYRGSRDNRNAAQAVVQGKIPTLGERITTGKKAVIIVDEWTSPVFMLYWQLSSLPMQNANGMPMLIPANMVTDELKALFTPAQGTELYIYTRNHTLANAIQKRLMDTPQTLEVVHTGKCWKLFRSTK